MNPIVEVKNLSVLYGSTEALHEANLNIFPTDFLGVIGPNGGGKTSLVKALLKLIPYSGEVIYSPEIERNGERKIGYLPQINDLDRSFPISVGEVVISGLQARKGLFRKYTKEDKQLSMKVMQLCGVADLASKSIGRISGGQLQRTLLGRSLISDPKLLILDEPANFVDSSFERELYEILKNLNERMAIVMVSHDLGTISSYVKSIVCVNKTIHRHNSNLITAKQLQNYNCPIQVLSHGEVPHTVLKNH